MRWSQAAVWALLGLIVAVPGAAGQTTPSAPTTREAPTPGQAQQTAQGSGLWERSNLLGDIGGARSALASVGISLGATETSEVLGNPSGGRARGVIYEGATELSLGIDLDKAVSLPGGMFNVSAWQIHGRGLTTNNLDNLNVVSAIEADRATRLFELWYQQSLLGGKLDIRLGQLAADQEFIISQSGDLFLNSSFGWPTLATFDLPAGGPAYPLATPGVRLRARPNAATTLLLGVFNGTPGGSGTGDPQARNPSGANLRFQGAFVIAEAQVALNQGEGATGLPATYKLGGWYNSNAVADPFANAGGQPAGLPAPAASGPHSDNWSMYTVLDQLVFRPPGLKDGGLGVFLRAMGAPANRNQIVAFVDAGGTYKGPFGRANDTVGLGVGWARVSGAATAADRTLASLSGGLYPVRGAETMIELTYQAQLAPWWQVQPDVQYVVRPGGGIVNAASGKIVGDAAVLGLRTVVTF